jgi:hypothetical protein
VRALRALSQPVGTRQVEHAPPALEQRRHHVGGRILRQRQEHRVGVARQHVDIERHDRAVPEVSQTRQCAVRTRRRRPHRRGDPDVGMPHQQPDQLLARIAGRARHPDGDVPVLRHGFTFRMQRSG